MEGFEKTEEYKDKHGRYRPTQIDLYKSFIRPLLDTPEFASKGIIYKKRGGSHVIVLNGSVRLPVRTVPAGKTLDDLEARREPQEDLLQGLQGDTLFNLVKREYVLCVALYDDRLRDGAKAIGVAPLDEKGQPCWENVVILDGPDHIETLTVDTPEHEDDFAETVEKMKISEPEIVQEGDAEENGGESTSRTA